jgi:hypothetical protein
MLACLVACWLSRLGLCAGAAARARQIQVVCIAPVRSSAPAAASAIICNKVGYQVQARVNWASSVRRETKMRTQLGMAQCGPQQAAQRRLFQPHQAQTHRQLYRNDGGIISFMQLWHHHTITARPDLRCNAQPWRPSMDDVDRCGRVTCWSLREQHARCSAAAKACVGQMCCWRVRCPAHRLARGEGARRRGTGSHNIPHRLNADERPAYEAAKKRVRC